MRFLSSAQVAAAALGFCLVAPAQDLANKVGTVLAQADGGPVDRVYQVGYDVAELVTDNNGEQLHDAIVKAIDQLGDKGRLAAACALENLKDGDTYGKDILDVLKPVAESKDQKARAAAVALLGEERHFNQKVLPKVATLLEQNTKDELVAPEVRVQAATSLWRVGSNEQRGTAKATLTQFLAAADRDLQIRGALALAAINSATGKSAQILRDIQNEPTDAGRLAQLYLKCEEERRTFESRLAQLIDQKPAIADDSKYRVLKELMARVRLQHIRGAEITDDEMIENAAKGMLTGLDPHSTYFTSDEFQRFFFDLNREYGGIGAFVNFDGDNDFAITRPIYSGPAYKAGLLTGDKIIEVDGWETANHTSEEIIARLKGRPDSTVVIKVFRPGWPKAEDFSIARKQIQVPSVTHTLLPGDIGYVELVNFSANTNEELDAAIKDLMAKKARGIVLDVRNNTGGYLTQARDVVEKFVPGTKLVVYTEGPAEPRHNYETRNRAICDLPLAVLTNGFSASASEILSGALQDLDRAVIVGERTFGKGSVQNMMGLHSQPGEEFDDLNGDGAWEEGEPFKDANGNKKYDVGPHIKLTVARYFLPSGRCPHKEFDKDGRIHNPNWGVLPDKQIELLDRKPEDAWKNAVLFTLLRKNVFKDYVKKNLESHQELFLQLAEGDEGDSSRYPDFDAFYQGLSTQLPKDDVRKWLRYEVRDQVSDLRGTVYPGFRALGDPQEDAQLQEALRTLMLKQGVDIRSIAQYKNVLKIQFGQEPRTGAK
ncbi:MAG TPA: S41 family peptidase [Planctomycetota bacterium]|nr:S41 family peptidase [Planctomycetota bacterium]